MVCALIVVCATYAVHMHNVCAYLEVIVRDGLSPCLKMEEMSLLLRKEKENGPRIEQGRKNENVYEIQSNPPLRVAHIASVVREIPLCVKESR